MCIMEIVQHDIFQLLFYVQIACFIQILMRVTAILSFSGPWSGPLPALLPKVIIPLKYALCNRFGIGGTVRMGDVIKASFS